jgi:hypothetical protein
MCPVCKLDEQGTLIHRRKRREKFEHKGTKETKGSFGKALLEVPPGVAAS